MAIRWTNGVTKYEQGHAVRLIKRSSMDMIVGLVFATLQSTLMNHTKTLQKVLLFTQTS